MPDDPSSPDYWNDAYLSRDTGWDKGRPSPPVVRLAREGFLPAGASLVVPGAGKGHEAVALAALGFEVSAIDFAAEAIKAIRSRRAGVRALREDVFRMAERHRGEFDGLVEHTCFCAIDPRRRGEYVQAAREVLKPGGIAFGVFYHHRRKGGPPFDVTAKEIRRLFSPAFRIERLQVAPDSFEERSGKELEFVFRKA